MKEIVEFCQQLPTYPGKKQKAAAPFFKQLLQRLLAVKAAKVVEIVPGRGMFRGTMFAEMVPKQFRDGTRAFQQQRGFSLHLESGSVCRLCMVSLVPRSEPFYRDAVNKVWLWMSLLDGFQSGETNVFIYLLPDRKELPPSRGLGIEHVNTAFTRRNDPEINIFREEEWFKVLIHETFHNHGLDFLSHGNAQACFPAVRSDVLLAESVCEFWANLMHTLLMSFELSGYRSFAHWELMYDIECTFARVQCVKVLRHYGLRYADLLDARYTFDEPESNAFAYYVVKCVMMHCGFLEWHVQANGPTLRFLEKNVEGFCQWLYTSCRNKKFMRALRDMEEVVSFGVVGKTLRMVAF